MKINAPKIFFVLCITITYAIIVYVLITAPKTPKVKGYHKLKPYSNTELFTHKYEKIY